MSIETVMSAVSTQPTGWIPRAAWDLSTEAPEDHVMRLDHVVTIERNTYGAPGDEAVSVAFGCRQCDYQHVREIAPRS